MQEETREASDKAALFMWRPETTCNCSARRSAQVFGRMLGGRNITSTPDRGDEIEFDGEFFLDPGGVERRTLNTYDNNKRMHNRSKQP